MGFRQHLQALENGKNYYDFIDDKVNDFLAWTEMRVDLNE